jgi:hypothetical protein
MKILRAFLILILLIWGMGMLDGIIHPVADQSMFIFAGITVTLLLAGGIYFTTKKINAKK